MIFTIIGIIAVFVGIMLGFMVIVILNTNLDPISRDKIAMYLSIIVLTCFIVGIIFVIIDMVINYI